MNTSCPPVIFFPLPSVLIFLQSPSPPPSISTSEQKKAIDNHATTFCCRLRPIRANHSTVGVVARRLLCVWLVAAWEFGLGGGGKGQPSVCLPACLPVLPTPPPPLSCPVALLSGVGFKGKETHHWLLTPINHSIEQNHFINMQKLHTAAVC